MNEAKGRGSTRGESTYATASRLARLVVELLESPRGVSAGRFCDRFSIDERTLFRYVNALNERVFFEPGRRRVQTATTPAGKVVRFVGSHERQARTPRELLSLYLAQATLKCLEGTVLKEDVATLWRVLSDGLAPDQKKRLKDVPRKFYFVPYAIKSYAKQDQLVNQLVRAVTDQHRMVLDYGGKHGDGKTHTFDPYTVAMYRGGLYLIGYSHLRKKIIWLAVERIRSVETAKDAEGQVRFEYPRNYSPERHTEGTFGIVDNGGQPTEVVLKILNRETEALLRPRRLHASQRFSRGRDGKTVLTMTLSDTREITNWVMSLQPWVEVIRPPALRAEIAHRLQEALQNTVDAVGDQHRVDDRYSRQPRMKDRTNRTCA